MFTTSKTIHLHDTDAAGRVYFAHVLRLAHEGYEAWMSALGFPLGELLANARYALPIVHAEADFSQPLRVGDEISLDVGVSRVGASSFTVVCQLRKGLKPAARVVTVHVAVVPKTGKKVALPARLRAALLKAQRA